MNCKYYYGSQAFDSELELDDFLLSDGPRLLEKYSDFVAQEQLQIRQLKWAEIVDELERISSDIKGETKYNFHLNTKEFEGKGTVSVTKFLSGLEINGNLIFPEFIEENYFKERIKSWRSNKEHRFTLRELADFAEEPEFLNNKIPEVLSQELIDRLIAIEKNKWENEAKVGSAIHNLCEIFFSRISKNEKNKTYRIWGDETDTSKIMAAFYRKADKDTLLILSKEQMLDVITYCRKLKDEIESTYGGKNGGKFLYYPELKVKSPATDPETNKPIQLSGIIDLLVVPPEGDPFIIDYKVSPNDYEKEAKREDLPEDIEPDAYNRAKKLGFAYQLSTYGRMMGRVKPQLRSPKVLVAPIQIMEYERKNGAWNYKHINSKTTLLHEVFKSQVDENHVQENLSKIFANIGIAQIDDTDMLKKIKETLMGWFTKYKSKEIGWSIRDIEELIEDKNHSYKENEDAENEEEKFSYKLIGGKTIYGKTKLELIKHISEEIKGYEDKLKSNTKAFKDLVTNENESYSLSSNRLEHSDGDTSWYSKILRKYSENKIYSVIGRDLTELVELPSLLEDLGIILLKNTLTGHIEIITLTNEKVDGQLDRRNTNKLITQGLGISDIVDKSGEDFLLEAVNGNAKIIETLLALHFIPKEVFAGSKIHSIKVINPFLNSGLTASNKQIIYAYKTLNKYKPLDSNFGKNRIFYDGNDGDIKFCSAIELALDSLTCGFKLRTAKHKSGTITKQIYNKCLTPLEEVFLDKDDEVIDLVGSKLTSSPKNNIEAILLAIIEMEDLIPGLRERTLKKYDFDVTDEEIELLYQSLLRALAEESGYDYKLQIRAYDNYKDSWNIFFGHSGLRTDNPGTTASSNLNKITEFIDNCLKRVTDSIQRPHAITQDLIIKMKKERGITYLGDSTFQNSIKIYESMTNAKNRKADDDWLFVNPYAQHTGLSTTEEEFLKYILLRINYNRYHKRGEKLEDFEERQIDMLNKGNTAWLRVPLSYKGTQGKLETQGLVSAAADYFKSWGWNEAKARVKKDIEHLLTPEGIDAKDDLYAVRTRFDLGEKVDKRAEMLKDINSYDHDLQSVFLNHMFAYKMKEESQKACMLIKAAHVDIINQELMQNRKREAETKYLTDNVKIMLGKPLMDEEDLQIYYFAKKIMKLASVGALGFNPKQLYQLLEGIYKDIGIVWRNEDGKYGFTLKEMIDSFIDVYKEFGKFGFYPTKLERINLLYRINDMDINVYALHLQNSHNIFRNSSMFVFRLASRPDYYNRMTIFESYMRHDGVWDAHYLNDRGELIYDFNLDKRFDLLAKGDVNNPKYRELEALYIAMAKLFEIEEAIYPDGTKFKFEKPVNGVYKALPQAYTNKQAHSYKAMADKMYGYYSHEKKALMQASLLGALVWQMNTYWSGKKNQWLAISSVKDRGWFTHYSEVVLDEQGNPLVKDGKEVRNYYYYQVDKDGNILFSEPPVTMENLINKDIIIPFYQWEGSFSEGIVVTITSMLNDVIAMNIADKDSFIIPRGDLYEDLLNEDGTYSRNLLKLVQAVHSQYWNNKNENLRTAYRQNIKQLAYDMSVLFIMGSIVSNLIHQFINDYTNDHKDDHTIQSGLTNASLALAESIFDTSTLDFNPIESVAGRGINWTPFAITTMTRLLKLWSRVIAGDDTLLDGFLNTFSANRTTLKPLIKQITDPAVKREKKLQELADHEGPEPTQQEAYNAVSLYLTMSSLSKAYAL